MHSIELPHSEGRHLSGWIQKYSLGRLNLLTRPPPSTMLAPCFHATTSRMNLQARLAMDGLRPQGVQLDNSQSFRRQACKLEALPVRLPRVACDGIAAMKVLFPPVPVCGPSKRFHVVVSGVFRSPATPSLPRCARIISIPCGRCPCQAHPHKAAATLSHPTNPLLSRQIEDPSDLLQPSVPLGCLDHCSTFTFG